MGAPKISVIIPVYNAEQYLEHCINSIIKQTFVDFELLLVDDCSSDKSREICKKYAVLDKRIKIFCKDINEGTAQARKTGIHYAKAEYIIFADNDDWVEPVMLEELYKKAVMGNYDMVFCDFFYGEKYFRQNMEDNDKYKFIEQIISWGDFFPITWNKLIKKVIYEKVIFPTTTYSEDRAIMTQVLFFCSNIGYVNKAFYHWCDIPTSASRNKKNGINNLIEDFISYIMIVIFLKKNMENQNELMNKIVNHAGNLGHLCSGNVEIIECYKNSIKKIIEIIIKNGNESIEADIEFEKNKFIEQVKELGKKNIWKYLSGIKKTINRIKRFTKNKLKIIRNKILYSIPAS